MQGHGPQHGALGAGRQGGVDLSKRKKAFGLKEALARLGGRLIGQHVVKRRAKGIDIGAHISVRIIAAILFERGVKRGALSLNNGDSHFIGGEDLDQAKIHQLDQPIGHDL